MMTFQSACQQAQAFFQTQLGCGGLASAAEDTVCWYFTPGEPGVQSVGTVVIGVDKATGDVAVVDCLSKEGFERLRHAAKVLLPEEADDPV